jgi:hypothetical protein
VEQVRKDISQMEEHVRNVMTSYEKTEIDEGLAAK